MPDEIATKTPSKEQFHIARSCLLDRFAEVEESVICLQARFGHKANTATLGQRLEALRKVKAGPQLSTATVTQLQGAIQRLTELNALRVDVVHARMFVAPVAGGMRACFINSLECSEEFPSARLLTFEQFNKVNRELHELAAALTKVAVKASPNPAVHSCRAFDPPPASGT